jgi:hypothetical protein
MPSNPTTLIITKQVSTELTEKQLLRKAIGFIENAKKQLNFHKMQSVAGNLQSLQKRITTLQIIRILAIAAKKTNQHYRATQTAIAANITLQYLTKNIVFVRFLW